MNMTEIQTPASEGALAVDQRFFQALRMADTAALAELLADDFLLIDVLQGGEISRSALIDAVRSGLLTFDVVDVAESRVRRYGAVAVVTGRTRMGGRAGDQPWSARSRYTHVFVEQRGRWRMVSAQGTQIAPD
jgi:ketosteroid isomerase-like protein